MEVIFWLTLGLNFFLQEENLVVNGNFDAVDRVESYSLEDCFSWYQSGGSSADYYSALYYSSNPSVSVPENRKGYQMPRSGKGYVGLLLFHRSVYFKSQKENFFQREHLQTKLKSPMIAGAKYSVTAYISLAEKSDYEYEAISFCFSKHPNLFKDKNEGQLMSCPDNRLMLQNPDPSNSSDWVKIEGFYNAKGGETYLTISLFDEDLSFQEYKSRVKEKSNQTLIGENNKLCSSYYYLDDISVKRVDKQ